MDDFKKAGVVVLTANDLKAKCVCVKNKTRRRLMRIARKMGRHKLKEEVTMQVEEYPDDLSDIFPWIKPGEYIRVDTTMLYSDDNHSTDVQSVTK